MIRVALKLALAAAAVWAVFTFVPVRGRTLEERWRAAGGVPAFVEDGWAEVAAAIRPPVRPQKPGGPERPTERHTEADRRAVDRLVSEGLAERR